MRFKQKGFTLVELMVVVSVIAILAAIAIVSFRLARDRAGDSKVKAEMRAVASAQKVYYLDNEEFAVNLIDLGSTNYLESAVDSSISTVGTTASFYVIGELASGSNWCISDTDSVGVVGNTC